MSALHESHCSAIDVVNITLPSHRSSASQKQIYSVLSTSEMLRLLELPVGTMRMAEYELR